MPDLTARQCQKNYKLNKSVIDLVDPSGDPSPAGFRPSTGRCGGGQATADELAGAPARQLRRFRLLAVAILVTLLAVIWGGIACQLQREYSDAVERVELDTGNLAVAFEKYVESSLRGTDLALVMIRELWLHQPSAIDVAAQQLLSSRQNGGLALQYLIADAAGKVVYSTSSPSAARGDPSRVAAQEFFSTHRQNAELAAGGRRVTSRDRLFIGDPVRSPSSNQWLMFLSRPLYDPAERFLGVVAVVADPAHFSRSIESLNLGARGAATLALRNGSIIARSAGQSSPDDQTGKLTDFSGFEDSIRAGVVRQKTPLDDEMRILSFRQHPEYPIWVGVGKSEYDVLAPFYQLSVYYGALAALASIALSGLVFLLVRAQTRLVEARAQALDESGRYRGLIDNLPEGVVIFEAGQGKVEAFNEAASGLLGRSPEQMRALTLSDLQLGNPVRLGRQAVRVTRGEGEPIDIELSVATFNLGGQSAVQCLLRDVSDQRRIEGELHASRNLYRSLVTAMHEGVILHLDNGTIAACNPAAERILGLTAAELVGRHSVDLRWPAIREDGSIFPGAQHPAIVALGSSLPQRDVLMGLRKPGDEVTWLSINAEPLRHEATASPYAVVVSFTDVTARRADDQAQQEAAKFFAATREGIVVTDLNGRIRIVNPAFSEITGYTREEAVGERTALLSSGAHDQAFYQAMWQSLHERGEWQGEVSDRRKNGQLFKALLAISAVRDASGRPVEYVGLLSELSEQQQRLPVAESMT
jgi:PAS domain S-box-containing protein